MSDRLAVHVGSLRVSLLSVSTTGADVLLIIPLELVELGQHDRLFRAQMPTDELSDVGDERKNITAKHLGMSERYKAEKVLIHSPCLTIPLRRHCAQIWRGSRSDAPDNPA
jgi:hypothetical protein